MVVFIVYYNNGSCTLKAIHRDRRISELVVLSRLLQSKYRVRIIRSVGGISLNEQFVLHIWSSQISNKRSL